MKTALAPITGVILAGGHSRRMGRDKALLDLGGRPMIARVAEALGRVCAEVLVVDRDPDRYAFLGLPVVLDRKPGFGALSGLHAGLLALPRPYGLFVACDMPFLQPALLRYLAGLVTLPARAGAGAGDGQSDIGQRPASIPGPAPEDGRSRRLEPQPAGEPGPGPAPNPGPGPLEEAPAWDAVVPRHGGRPEPLLAIYGRHLVPVVENLLARGGGPLRLILEAPGVRVCWVEEPALRRFDPELRSLINVNTPQDYQRAVRRWAP
ncbi:MAG TPA: molybdenum cofactor guanylyltransferase [Thermaerobacter sp.]